MQLKVTKVYIFGHWDSTRLLCTA